MDDLTPCLIGVAITASASAIPQDSETGWEPSPNLISRPDMHSSHKAVHRHAACRGELSVVWQTQHTLYGEYRLGVQRPTMRGT